MLDQDVSATLRQIGRDEKSGLLAWESGSVKRQVVFERGGLVSARSSVDNERLGQILVRHGKVTAAQLEEATRFIASGKRLGRILVELGHVRGGEIEQYVRLHMLDVACAMLETAPRRLAFSDQVEVQPDTLSPLPVADVFLEAARRLPEIDVFRSLLMREGCRLSLSSDPKLRSQRVTLTPEEAFVLSRIQESAPTVALLAAGALPEEQMLRVLVGFIHAGLVELQLPPQTSSPGATAAAAADSPDVLEQEVGQLFNAFQCQNHWQVLGLERGASLEQIAEAYRVKASRYRPETFQNIADADFHEKLSYVVTRIEEAHKVLTVRTSPRNAEPENKDGVGPSPQESHPAPKPKRDPQEAKQLFLRAKKAHAANDHWTTIQLCRAAIELGENDPEHFYLLGVALGQNPKWRHDAEQNLNIAIKLSPWEPKYHVALAELYHRGGLQQRARKVLAHLATIDPNYPIPRLGQDEPREPKPAGVEKVGQLIRKLSKRG